MKKNYFFGQKLSSIFIILLLLFCCKIYGQNAPDVKKILQTNTLNGGKLVQTVMDNSGNTIFAGYANGNDFQFDGYVINPIGIEDLYVIKDDAAGNNLWMKNLNAGISGTIRPRYIKTDDSGNIYVIANFKGLVTIGTKTYNSSTGLSGLLIKLDANGNDLWSAAVADSNLKDYDISFTNDGELFALSSSSNIYRVDSSNGSIINSFTSKNLTSIDYKNNSLYIGGYTKDVANTIGSLSIDPDTGFVLKGDRNFNFNSFLKFVSSSSDPSFSVVKDVKFLKDETLEIVGISAEKVHLVNDAGLSLEATYGNEGQFKAYLWAAKVKADFSAVDWFKASANNSLYDSSSKADLYDVDLYPFGDSQAKLFYRTTDNVFDTNIKFFNGFTFPRSKGSFILDIDKSGGNVGSRYWFVGNNESITFKYINSVETLCSYDQTIAFQAVKFSYFSGYYTEYWKKNIPNLHGGNIKSNYLKSDSSGNSYINVVTAGEVNLFGRNFNSGSTNFANVYSKISPSGTTVWNARIIYTTSTTSGYNIYNTDVNTAGEMVSVVKVPRGSPSGFIANSGTVTEFQSGNLTNLPSYNEIIKISSAGELAWHRRIDSNSTFKTSTFFDRDGNVIIWGGGIPNAVTIVFDGITYTNIQGFLIKLDGNTGNVIYFKNYSGLNFSTGKMVFDEQNNIYAFYEPNPYFRPNAVYTIGNVTIQGNADGYNSLMVKLDSNGNAVWGKNFYENLPQGTYSYSFPIDAKYDGNNLILYSLMLSNGDNNFIGIDRVKVTSPYTDNATSNSLSKITKEGTVLGSTPIFADKSEDGNQFDIDSDGNSYIYGTWGNKINVNGQEFALNNSGYASAILKFSPNGVINYVKKLYNQTSFNNNLKISILSKDFFNVSGNVNVDKIENFPINNLGGDNYYIATLGIQQLQTIENQNSVARIYPNPSSDVIYVQGKEIYTSAEVYDRSGRLVNKIIDSKINMINIQNLIQGTYLLKLSNQNNSQTIKFIRK